MPSVIENSISGRDLDAVIIRSNQYQFVRGECCGSCLIRRLRWCASCVGASRHQKKPQAWLLPADWFCPQLCGIFVWRLALIGLFVNSFSFANLCSSICSDIDPPAAWTGDVAPVRSRREEYNVDMRSGFRRLRRSRRSRYCECSQLRRGIVTSGSEEVFSWIGTSALGILGLTA